jgi:lysophospholipase L1-like esterase
MTKGLPRRIFHGFVAVLWLVAALIAAEIGARVYDLRTRSSNEFIQAELSNSLFPERTARLQEARPLTLPEVPPAANWPATPDTGAWPMPLRYDAVETREDLVKRRAAFAGLTERERQVAAFMHCELVLRLVGRAEDGFEAEALYGAYHAQEQLRTVMQAIAPDPNHPACRATATGVMSTGAAPLHPALGELQAEYLAETGGGAVYAFMNLRDEGFLRILLIPYEAPPDSPWLIPFVQYKPHQTGLTTLGAEFNTNNYGLRDDDTEVPKPEGRLRILCLGGSTTEEGPTNALTYPNMLERALQARFPGQDIEVVNGGVSGMTLFTHHLRLPDYLEMNPDLVLLYIGINDVVQKYLAHAVPSAWQPLAHSELLRRVAPGALYPRDMRDALEREVIPHVEALCRALLRQGIPVMVGTFAYPGPAALDAQERVFFDYNARTWPPKPYAIAMHARAMAAYNAGLHALAARLELPLVPFAELMRGGSEYFGDICHMRDGGIARKAAIAEAYIAPMLEDRLSPAGSG